jgi:hypothetical protein
VADKFGVNMLACICAIDRAALPDLMNYWVTGADVTGVHELVGNALILPGEKKRETDLRGENPCREWRKRLMNDKGKIITGIIIIFVVATFPFWFNMPWEKRHRRPSWS